MQTEESSEIDFMESIGLEVKPATPEEAFLMHLNEGKCGKIHSIRYWLIHEIARYQDMLKNNLEVVKLVFDINTDSVVKKPITSMEYAKVAINYHLRSNFYGWFMDTANRRKCDLAKVVQLIVELPMIVEVIEKKY